MSQFQDFWGQVKSNLKGKNSENKLFQMWFDPTSLISVEETNQTKIFRLGVPSELHKYWISQNILDRICTEISALCNGPFNIELVVTGENKTQSNTDSSYDESELAKQVTAPAGINPRAGTDVGFERRESLNPDLLFSTFVVGRNNEFAHAACFNIAENPGAENYNPLFICGPTGMGKTHLLNAVGNQMLSKNPRIRICYVSAESFLNECISSIRRGQMDRFRQRYREQCDVLLIDDIYILGRGEAVQEEFFHTLNHFFEKGQQVVVASDRMPKDIKGLEDRIRTRLEWGLIADIQMPDLETRVAILRYKAERKQIRLPNEVINYMARISKRSIRDLEGTLNKVKMYSELQGLEINMDLARKVLANHDDTTQLSMDEILKIVSTHYNVRIIDLKSQSRTKQLVRPRQIAMFLAKKYLDKSLVEIGQAFGGRDHTTVLNALRRVEDHTSKDAEIKRDMDDLETRIHSITGV